MSGINTAVARDSVKIDCSPASDLTLTVTEGVHFDPDNLPLTDKDALTAALGTANEQKVLYQGCGAGIIGLLILRHKLASYVHFADNQAEAVEIAATNAASNGFTDNQYATSNIDLTKDPAPMEDGPYTSMICNPPQMPGPPELLANRPDKYGGPDGLTFYRQLAAYAPVVGVERVAFLQTSMSSFEDANKLFEANGYSVTTVKEQPRGHSAKGVDGLAPGMLRWMLQLRKNGGAAFEADGDLDAWSGGENVAIRYTQRIAVAVKK